MPYWEKTLFQGWDPDWECEPIPNYVMQREWRKEQERVENENKGNEEPCEKDKVR